MLFKFVYQNYILELPPIQQYIKVFHLIIAIFVYKRDYCAEIAMQGVFEQIRACDFMQRPNYWFSVCLMPRCENHQFRVFFQFLEHFDGVRPDGDKYLFELCTILDLQMHVVLFINKFGAVTRRSNEGFIQIKHKGKFFYII